MKKPVTARDYLRYYYDLNWHAEVVAFGDGWVVEVITKFKGKEPYYQPVKNASGFIHSFDCRQSALNFLADSLEGL